MPDVTNDSLRDGGVTDTGHTSGGGSLGHDQPEEVVRDTPTRNATDREDARGETDTDPVMPSDDSTLNTKI